MSSDLFDLIEKLNEIITKNLKTINYCRRKFVKILIIF
jgi:hypothetical protein